MSDMYEKVQSQRQQKKERAVPLAVGAGVVVLLVLLVVILQPISTYRHFMGMVENLSGDTVYACRHGCLHAAVRGAEIRVNEDNAYLVYNKIIAGGKGKRSRAIPEGESVVLDYGNGAVLELWQLDFQSSDKNKRSSGVFVQYTGADGKQYSYITDRITLGDFTTVLSPEKNALWQESGE